MAVPFQNKSGRIALGGILTAISVVILYLASVMPSGRLGIAALAGLCPVFAVLLAGRKVGFMVWGSSSVLAMILVPDKGIALAYLILFGLYPVVKSLFEGIHSRILEWIFKIAYGGLGVLVLRYFLLGLLMQAIPQWLSDHMILFYPLGLVVFILYDIALSRIIRLMRHRTGQ